MNPKFIICLLVLYFMPSFGLKCYQCAVDGCGDPFNATNVIIEECGYNSTAAVKFSAALNNMRAQAYAGIGSECLKIKLDNSSEVERGCIPAINGFDACTVIQTLAGDVGMDCEVCDTDLCNASSLLQPTLMIITITCALYCFIF